MLTDTECKEVQSYQTKSIDKVKFCGTMNKSVRESK